VARKKMSDNAQKFIETGEVAPQAQSQADGDLREELLGERQADESRIRLTVDLPRSLHRRLNQLALDSGKPKTELVRIIIRRTLDSIDY